MKTYKFKIDDRTYAVDIVNAGDKTAVVNVNGVLYEVEIEQKQTAAKHLLRKVDFVPSTDMSLPRIKTNPADDGGRIVRSPLPGKIIDVLVKEGESVSIGQTLVCIEAMKMENNIRADREGIIQSVSVQVNDVVAEGSILLEIGDAIIAD